MRQSLCSLAIGATVLGCAAALFLARNGLPSNSPAEPADLAADIRARLSLRPVLDAEQAVSAVPGDPTRRVALAESCARSGDPVGAALALYPLSNERGPAEVGEAFARYCADAGWLEEAEEAVSRAPSAPARLRLHVAQACVARGEPARAARLLKPLGKGVLLPEEQLAAAAVWLQCRQPDKASRWAARALAAEPHNQSALVAVSRSFLSDGRPEDALGLLGNVPRLTTDPAVQFWRARAELRSEDRKVRQSGLERVTRLAASKAASPMVLFEAGRALTRAGKPRRAIPLLARAIPARHQEVLCYEWLSRAYAADGNQADAAWARGRAQMMRAEFREAAASLRDTLASRPEDVRAQLDLARALFTAGDYQGSLDVLRRAEKLAPRNFEIAMFKGKVYQLLERIPDHVRELRAAVELGGDRANEPLGELGTTYYASQQFDRAIPLLEQAISIEPSDAHAHLYLGLTYGRHTEDARHTRKAVEHLLRAAELQPDYFYPWTTAALLLQRMGHLPEATACCRRAIAGEPQSDGAYLMLAKMLQHRGQTSERSLVLRLYRRFRDLDLRREKLRKESQRNPRSASLHYAYGDLLLRAGQHRRACDPLLRAASLKPEWRAARERLADACALLGYDDLREEAEHALR